MSLRDVILGALVAHFDWPADEGAIPVANKLTEVISEYINGRLFGVPVAFDADQLGPVDSVAAGLAREDDEATQGLFERCKAWTGGQCEVEHIAFSGPAVRLGDGAYLAFEELEEDEAAPVLGYDTEAGKVFFHQMPLGTEAWVTNEGLIVLRHPDIVLTSGGIGEGLASLETGVDLEDADED